MTESTPRPPVPDPSSPAEPAAPASPTPPPTRAPVAAPAGRTSPLVWVVALALAAMVGALLFVGGYLAAGATGAGSSCAAPSEAFVPFCEAYSKLKDRYVDKLDDTKLAEGAIQGMFQYGGPDQFSGYMSPEDYQRALSSLSGEFSGIGAEMGVKNLGDPSNAGACTAFSDSCVLVVTKPLPNTPAEKAGLQPGDQVVAVDGTSVNGKSLSQVVDTVRGQAGTDVTLTIKRGDETFDETITREKIQQSDVDYRMLSGNVGYIALHTFSDVAAQQFHDGLATLQDQGATSFIFDLRDDGGGYIDTARKVASEFIKSGLIFIQESSGNEVKRWEATGDGLVTNPDIPVVVLVNGYTASASEIVSAALQERGRATIVGQPTYGKNTVQLWENLDNGGGVRITISRWFTPDHNSVAPGGIQPDVTVEVPPGTPPERDLFVERALQILNQTPVSADASASAEPASGSTDAPTSLVPALPTTSWTLVGPPVATA